MPATASRLQVFTESVIRGMSRLATRHGAINLAQGFPDFDPPEPLLAALERATRGPFHQYAVTWGAPRFREALARKIARRTEVNKSRKSRVRTFVRKVEEAVASGDKAAAVKALKAAEPEIMRGVTKGVLHKNTASRKVSRLAARVKAVGA